MVIYIICLKRNWYYTLSLKRKLTDVPQRPSIKLIFYQMLYKFNHINSEALLLLHPGLINGYASKAVIVLVQIYGSILYNCTNIDLLLQLKMDHEP